MPIIYRVLNKKQKKKNPPSILRFRPRKKGGCRLRISSDYGAVLVQPEGIPLELSDHAVEVGVMNVPFAAIPETQ